MHAIVTGKRFAIRGIDKRGHNMTLRLERREKLVTCRGVLEAQSRGAVRAKVVRQNSQIITHGIACRKLVIHQHRRASDDESGDHRGHNHHPELVVDRKVAIPSRETHFLPLRILARLRSFELIRSLAPSAAAGSISIWTLPSFRLSPITPPFELTPSVSITVRTCLFFNSARSAREAVPSEALTKRI